MAFRRWIRRGFWLGTDKENKRTGPIEWVAPLIVLTAFLSLPDVSAQVSQGPSKNYTEEIVTESGDTFRLQIVSIPAGTFKMGSPAGEEGRGETEGPQRDVTLSNFYLSATEIPLDLFLAYYRETMTEKNDYLPQPAQSDVDAISGPTPVYGDLQMGAELDTPAIGMTWHNAVTFCKWLSKKTGKTYRLPTEAEWEYACKSSTANRYGATDSVDALGEYAWYIDNANEQTSRIGSKKPNAWGLFDMSGNVAEWVHDFYSPGAYAEAATENPQGPAKGRVHVARGGDFDGFPEDLRCSARSYEQPDWRAGDPQLPKSTWWLPFINTIGFRVARSADPQ